MGVISSTPVSDTRTTRVLKSNAIEPEDKKKKRRTRATYPIDQPTTPTFDEDAFVQPSYLVVDYDDAHLRVYGDFLKGGRMAKYPPDRGDTEKARDQK